MTGRTGIPRALLMAVSFAHFALGCSGREAPVGKGSQGPSLPPAPTLLSASANVKPEISTRVSFRCLWWSAEQMIGLNPNAPPPKTMDVPIQKWEYSDPIGVPHPDVVDLVIEVRNESAVAADLVAEAKARWRIGPFSDEGRAEWGEEAPLRREGPFDLGPHQSRTIRIPIDLAGKMTKLQSTAAWPYALRVDVAIAQVGSGGVVGSAGSELPILRGD